MAIIDSSALTVPGPLTDNDSENELKLAYVYLQLLTQAKAESFVLDDGELTAAETAIYSGLWAAQSGVVSSQTVMLNNIKSRFNSAQYPELASLCDGIMTENAAMAAMAMSKKNYDRRCRVLQRNSSVLLSLLTQMQVVALYDLQFNSQEISLDWLNVLLLGRNAILTP